MLLAAADCFPSCSVLIKELEVQSSLGENLPVAVLLEITCGVEVGAASKAKGKYFGSEMISVFTCTSNLDFVDYRRVPWVLPHRLKQTNMKQYKSVAGRR